MNIPLLAGRTFTEQDMAGKAKVAIVNANLARKYFGDPKNAVGQLMARGSGSDVKFDIEIIGVVGDTRHRDMRTRRSCPRFTGRTSQRQPSSASCSTTCAPGRRRKLPR